MLEKSKSFLKIVLVCFFVFSLFGCASNKFQPTDPKRDPLEYYNRKIFAFNMVVDKVFYKPVATVYDTVLPWQIKRGVSNFFNNIGDVTSAANSLLQLHFVQVGATLARIVINTTAGLGGLFDVASSIGLDRDQEDFGLTLAKWGSKNTPYLVLPFIGPFTLRDAVGFPIDYYLFSIWPFMKADTLFYSLRGTQFVQKRAKLLAGDKLIEQSFDPYLFVRDAYLQRRAYLVKESGEEHVKKYVDENGISHRRHRSIPANSVVSE